MLDALEPLTGGRLLDVACGPGDLTAAAARRGAMAQGLDFAPTMVDLARERHPGVAFSAGDAHALPFDAGTFDAVACAFGLLHLADPDAALREARRVLAPGGRLAFTVWCARRPGSASRRSRRYRSRGAEPTAPRSWTGSIAAPCALHCCSSTRPTRRAR
jgi:ubiquinone/menaquinone biosynthesis C-methylase UbiE